MKVRTRLLAGSLAVAVVLSLVLGWAIARMRDDDNASAGQAARPTFDVPSIETNAVVKGTALPSANVQLLDGTSVDVASLTGQPMVINIWGSTCGPCKAELPDFAAAHLTYGDQVRFVGIDYLAPSAREEAFARDRGVQYELLYDGNGEFITAAGIAAFPVTLFVDSDGLVVRQTGQLDEATLAHYIESELL